jgi:thymidine phosphorylase
MSPPTNAIEIIRRKRDGHTLSDEQIDWFIAEYSSDGAVSDQQAAAMCMAIYFQGLDNMELRRWTDAMVDSGETLDLRSVDRPTVDKHSTGGVGDKISLTVVPLVAACGAAVPQLSGRGLGYTGGTLDKLEAIPGWSPELTATQLRQQLDEVGCVIAGASKQLVPADRKLYSLRDATGTIESLPLIASSIMSKKIAENLDGLVLDVKTGRGAFMRDVRNAKRLARMMVNLGASSGLETVALITDMNHVLGNAVGNGVEVQEAIDVLEGGGPDDVVRLTLLIAEAMLETVGIEADVAGTLRSGAALDVFDRMVRAQGGRLDAGFGKASHVAVVEAQVHGQVRGVHALAAGRTAWLLGAGRSDPGDPVDPAAGLIVLAPLGTEVSPGDPLLELRASSEAKLRDGLEAADSIMMIGERGVLRRSLLIDRITSDNAPAAPPTLGVRKLVSP